MYNEQSYYARMRSTMSDKLSALDGQVQKGTLDQGQVKMYMNMYVILKRIIMR